MNATAVAPETPGGLVPFRTRTQALFAADGRTAVLLRRGPKTHFNLISWDLRQDRFESGQWMKGQVRLCDLSPDGSRLLYWAAQYHPSAGWRETRAAPFEPLAPRPATIRPGRKAPRYLSAAQAGHRPAPRAPSGTWTALSRPPYFTALAFWPAIGTWSGGGGFASDQTIVLFEREDGLTPIASSPPPPSFRVLSSHALPPGRPWGGSARQPVSAPNEPHAELWLALQAVGVDPLDWLHQVGDDLLFSGGGRIFRLSGWRAVAPEERLRRAQLLIDLSSQRFRLLAAPRSALRW